MHRFLSELQENHIAFAESFPLAGKSTFRIGGEAEIAVFPCTEAELLTVLSTARKEKIPVTVIGNGSNVLFPDGGLRGAVVFTDGIGGMTVGEREIDASAGVTLARLAGAAKDASLSGGECLAGIPGSVGGAVFMNAGAFGGCVADLCAESRWYDLATGTTGVFHGKEQKFGNRTSYYATHSSYVILGAVFRFADGNRTEIAAKMKEYAERRRASQPLEYPSAGSVFKRPEGFFAGKLIEDCGLKGLTVGAAQVSQKHAGFIVNLGGATAKDVRELVENIRKTVLERTGILLEPEIRFL